MTEEATIQGTNFHCFHAGPMAEWARFHIEPPTAPRPVDGKLFLKNPLGLSGLELSLNVVMPGDGMPFLHKHMENDEVYFVVGGQGQFLIDGKCVDVREGSAIRISPPGNRAWRNNGSSPLYFICIQYPSNSQVQGGITDGRRGDGPLNWPC